MLWLIDMSHSFKYERKLLGQGYEVIIGLDEAGRGPLAGPVVAGAAAFWGKTNLNDKNLQVLKGLVKDSKKLSANKREKIYKIIIKNKNIKWRIGVISYRIIDKINILEATKLAMAKAIAKLKIKSSKLKVKVDNIILIIDGNQRINVPFRQITVVKGDSKVFLCSCASILAKVFRDRLMQKYHKKYPQYKFDQHKGYPTKEHYRLIKKYGISPIHRKSFNCG